jgi:hypothetical protein
MFSELSVRLSHETLEQIDDAVGQFQTAFTDREEFVEVAVEYALQSIRQESEMLMIGQEDELLQPD